MHADLETALSEHTRATQRWLALVEGVSPQQGGWRSAPERWSIAQCLDHVTITTSALLPGLELAIEAAHARGGTGTGPFRYGPLGRWFLAAQSPTSSARVRTPGRYRPAATDADSAYGSCRCRPTRSDMWCKQSGFTPTCASPHERRQASRP